jgi:hypothetical protein
MTAASASPAAPASRSKAASTDSASVTRPSSIRATNRQNRPWRSRRSSPAARARRMISDPAASRSAASAGSHRACSRASSTSASGPGSAAARASRRASSDRARRRGAADASPSSSRASRASTRARVAPSPARPAAVSSSRTRFRAAAVDVVDDDQPGRARHQIAGRAVQIQPPGIAVHQVGRQVIGCSRITEQLRPHQPPRLAPGGRRPQHVKPAMASLAGRRLRHRRLARARRADQNQHATRAVRSAVQQAADRCQLQAPPGGERVSRVLHPVVRSWSTPALQRSGPAAGTASGPCALAGRLAGCRLLRLGEPYPRYLGADRRRVGRQGLAWPGPGPDLDLSHGCSFR